MRCGVCIAGCGFQRLPPNSSVRDDGVSDWNERSSGDAAFNGQLLRSRLQGSIQVSEVQVTTTLQLALLSCLLLGLRHGFDYDHLAAITDITSMQRGWRWGMRMGLLYALGHALTVAVLGVCVIALHLRLPERLDAVGERFVGATLIVLAFYVLLSLWRSRSHLNAPGHAHVSQSRIALLISGAR